MSCMSRCAKYYLCLFNFVFFLAGGAALAVGVWLLADTNSFTQLVGQFDEKGILTNTDAHVIKVIAYLLIVAGTLTFILGFLGYCGAIFESRCLLCLYGVLKLIVLTIECVVVALALGLKGDAAAITRDTLRSTIEYYSSSADKAEIVTLAWDGIMSQMSCCGVDGYRDFEWSPSWRTMVRKVPPVCCIRDDMVLKDPTCPQSPSETNTYEGCFKVVTEVVESHASIVLAVGVSMVFIDVLSIFLALYLACCYWRPQHACVDVSSRQAW